MKDLILDIEQSYDKKIAMLQEAIQKLKDKKAMVVSSIKEDIGYNVIKSTTLESKTSSANQTTPIQEVYERNTRPRILRALDKMALSGFGIAELIKEVNADGQGREVNKNRVFRIVQKLVEEGIVNILRPRYGKEGGIYQKTIKGQQTPIVSVSMIRTKVGAPTRIKDALDKMEGDFSSADLLNAASKDGRGNEIPRNSFYPIFSNLMKDGSIIIVEKQIGSIPGIYKKAYPVA